MTQDHPTLLGAALGVIIALLLALAGGVSADRHLLRAYEARHGAVDERTLIARALIGEAGWLLRDDHPAILHVLRRRKTLPVWQRESFSELVLAYSAAVRPTVLRVNVHRAQVNRLEWDDVPGRIQRLVERFLAGEDINDQCVQPVWHWGSPQDTQRVRAGLVDCGETANRFLGAPVRERVFAPGEVLPARVARGRRR